MDHGGIFGHSGRKAVEVPLIGFGGGVAMDEGFRGARKLGCWGWSGSRVGGGLLVLGDERLEVEGVGAG